MQSEICLGWLIYMLGCDNIVLGSMISELLGGFLRGIIGFLPRPLGTKGLWLAVKTVRCQVFGENWAILLGNRSMYVDFGGGGLLNLGVA